MPKDIKLVIGPGIFKEKQPMIIRSTLSTVFKVEQSYEVVMRTMM